MGHILQLSRIGFFAVLTTQAQADCAPDQQEFTSCKIQGRDRQVSVCFTDDIVTYEYGSAGRAADLVLREPIATVDFEPWSGVGREIAESVTFQNGNYRYRVVGGFERLPPSDDHLDENGDPDARTKSYGWVEVLRNDDTLITLSCRPETVSYGFGGGLYDLKIALGLVWDGSTRRWVNDQ